MDLLRCPLAPREVLCNLQDVPHYGSYSDGEGSDAGVGTAMWRSSFEMPLAACYRSLVKSVRWSKQRENTTQHPQRDIFEIEAVGSLMVLATWPGQLRGCRWLHFIDNVASQAAFDKRIFFCTLWRHHCWCHMGKDFKTTYQPMVSSCRHRVQLF